VTDPGVRAPSARVPWSTAIAHLESSPHGPFDQCDLLLVSSSVEDGSLLVLLLDGSPVRGTNRAGHFRRRLFEIIAPLWPGCETWSVGEILRRLDEGFKDANAGGAGRLYASAVALRAQQGQGLVEVAEVGDTKAWMAREECYRPVWTEGLPRLDNCVTGALGTPRALVREQSLRLKDEQSVALMTDGAYNVLLEQGMRTKDGCLKLGIEDAFVSGCRSACDDANLLVLHRWW